MAIDLKTAFTPPSKPPLVKFISGHQRVDEPVDEVFNITAPAGQKVVLTALTVGYSTKTYTLNVNGEDVITGLIRNASTTSLNDAGAFAIGLNITSADGASCNFPALYADNVKLTTTSNLEGGGTPAYLTYGYMLVEV